MLKGVPEKENVVVNVAQQEIVKTGAEMEQKLNKIPFNKTVKKFARKSCSGKKFTGQTKSVNRIMEKPDIQKKATGEDSFLNRVMEKSSMKKAARKSSSLKKAAAKKVLVKAISMKNVTVSKTVNSPDAGNILKNTTERERQIKKFIDEIPVKNNAAKESVIKEIKEENIKIKKFSGDESLVKKFLREESITKKVKKNDNHLKNNIYLSAWKDHELRAKEELECQLAKYRANIRRMQKIIDQERTKMIRVQNKLFNLRRRCRRREIKEKETVKLTPKDEYVETVKTEKEIREEKPVDRSTTQTVGLKRRKVPAIIGMKKKKKKKLVLPGLLKTEEVREESTFKANEIESQNHVNTEHVKEKKDTIDQVREIQPKKRVYKRRKTGKLEGSMVKGVKKIKPEPGEENTKPAIQIATSHMLWNVLSHMKTDAYQTEATKFNREAVQGADIKFPLPPQNIPNPTDLSLLVKQFMLREDVSKSCSPQEEAPGVRYRMHYLSILHRQFVAEYGNLCNYKTFVKYVPNIVLRPSPQYWKVCPCFYCINPDIKYEKLNALGILQMNGLELGDIMINAEKEGALMGQLLLLRDSRDILSYDVWERNCSGGNINSKRRNVIEPIGIVVAKLQEELSSLKSHIQKAFCQLEAARLARERATHTADEVALHLDGCPLPVYCPTLPETGQADVAVILTVLTAYLWSEGGAQATVAMSDSKDYTTAAIWAGLEKLLYALVKAGKHKITIISDCPTSKYRNKSNFYLLNDFAFAYGICLRWIFLEVNHSIGNANIVRSEFDLLIRDRVSHSPGVPITSSSDVLSLVQTHSSAAVCTYTEDDVQRYKLYVPKLRVIRGTQQFYEVIVFPEEFWIRDVVGHDTFRKLRF